MTAHTGERVQQPGVFTCPDCGDTILVEVGDLVPSCRCGRNEYARDGAASAGDREVWRAQADY